MHEVVSNQRKLVEILKEIPQPVWDRVVKKAPEWQNLVSFSNLYGFGPFSVLMLVIGLNAYQLKGRAEIAYFPKIRELLEQYPTPRTPRELLNLLNLFYAHERLNSIKSKRLERFLKSPLASNLWKSSLEEISSNFIRIWGELTQLMGQRPQDKTIAFAMKCLGLSLLMDREHNFEFNKISIPVDSRVAKLTQRAVLCITMKDQEIQAVWNEILSDLQRTLPRITMIHLDSLVWQIGSLQESELRDYFKTVGIDKVGSDICNYLKL
ncbi:MAG: N-glycosylase/DNA lyase [Methanophagales archaeon]|nr:N-glycosylase/DNA lyase [Methanophagales archaeon]